jgi:putative phage-type endonuclease
MSLSEQQHEIRSKGIGGSDIAPIMGLSKWKTAHELWLEKTGTVEPDKLDSQVVHFGNVLEQVVADEFADRKGFKVRKRNNTFTHKKYPQLLANIDRSIDGEKAVLECKTSSAFLMGDWGEEMSEDVPDYYRVQVEHYMNVLGQETAYLAVLIGGNTFRTFFFERDPDLSQMIEDAAIDFWDMVLKGTPPPINYDHQTTHDMLLRRYPGTNGEKITLPAEIQPWHEVLVQTKEKIKELEGVKDGCANRIQEAMGENAIGIVPSGNFKYTRAQQSRKEFTVAANTFWVMRPAKYDPSK